MKYVNLNDHKENKIKREMIESELNFLGFILIHNKLKKETKQTIFVLKEANLGIKIISGDNIFTSINIAKETLIINDYQRVLICRIRQGNKGKKFVLEEIKQEYNEINKEIDYEERKSIFSANFKPENFEEYDKKLFEERNDNKFKDSVKIHLNLNESIFTNDIIDIPDLPVDLKNIVFAIQGDTFSILLEQKTILKDNSTELEKFEKFYKIFLNNCIVFSRMTPDNKAIIVEEYKELGHIVCMCGDGANDCSALKIANVGI